VAIEGGLGNDTQREPGVVAVALEPVVLRTDVDVQVAGALPRDTTAATERRPTVSIPAGISTLVSS
jgi:hypothetical protein